MRKLSEDEERHTQKALTGKLAFFDPSVFSEDNLHSLKHIAQRQGNTELSELLLEEELRRN